MNKIIGELQHEDGV